MNITNLKVNFNVQLLDSCQMICQRCICRICVIGHLKGSIDFIIWPTIQLPLIVTSTSFLMLCRLMYIYSLYLLIQLPLVPETGKY